MVLYCGIVGAREWRLRRIVCVGNVRFNYANNSGTAGSRGKASGGDASVGRAALVKDQTAKYEGQKKIYSHSISHLKTILL